jgi:hypothetical protein
MPLSDVKLSTSLLKLTRYSSKRLNVAKTVPARSRNAAEVFYFYFLLSAEVKLSAGIVVDLSLFVKIYRRKNQKVIECISLIITFYKVLYLSKINFQPNMAPSLFMDMKTYLQI